MRQEPKDTQRAEDYQPFISPWDDEPQSIVGMYFIAMNNGNETAMGGKILARCDGFYLFRHYEISRWEESVEAKAIKVLTFSSMTDGTFINKLGDSVLEFFTDRGEFEEKCKEAIKEMQRKHNIEEMEHERYSLELCRKARERRGASKIDALEKAASEQGGA